MLKEGFRFLDFKGGTPFNVCKLWMISKKIFDSS
jgi:hypothetical protein